MKILYIIPRFTTGGAEKTVLYYVEHFVECRHKVAVASVVGGGELENEFKKAGAEIILSPKKSAWQILRCWQNMYRWCRENQPDIVHTQVFSADITGWLLRRFGVIKHWISHQQNLEKNTPWHRRKIWQFILRSADKVIAVSHEVYKFCRDDWRLKNEQLTLIKNSIELEKWLKISSDSLLSREQIQLACIGRFWEQKGHKYLVSALAQIKALPWRLHLFGDGPLRQELEKQARELQINDRVTWHGVVHNIPDELKNIDVIIQPSLWEGLSLVVMEAMASGRLVIATHEAGKELLENKKTGLTVPSRNPEALAKSISWAFKQRQEARIIASAGREYAKKNFGIEKNIQQIEKIYQNI